MELHFKHPPVDRRRAMRLAKLHVVRRDAKAPAWHGETAKRSLAPGVVDVVIDTRQQVYRLDGRSPVIAFRRRQQEAARVRRQSSVVRRVLRDWGIDFGLMLFIVLTMILCH